MEIFTGHYRQALSDRRPPAPEARLFERADPVDRLLEPIDRNDL